MIGFGGRAGLPPRAPAASSPVPKPVHRFTGDSDVDLHVDPAETGSVARYHEVIRPLEEAGAGAPRGRLYHVTLMPMVQDVAIELAPPGFYETVNVID